MPIGLSEHELDFILNLIPNTKEIEDQLQNLAQMTKQMFDTNNPMNRIQIEILKSMTAQREELIRINQLMNPTYVQERLRTEKQILEARKQLYGLEHAERVNQAGGTANYAWQQVKNLFTGGGQGGRGGNTMAMLGAILGGQGGGGQLGQIGGAVGSSFGPGGSMMGSTAAQAIPKVIAAPAQLVAGALGSLSKALQGLQGPLGPITAGFGLLSGAMDGMANMVKAIPIVGQVFGPFVEALGKIPKIIGEVLSTLTALAAKASPGQAKLLQMAVEDVQAVVGAKFLPTMALLRDLIWKIGDVLANILPSGETFARIFKPLAKAFKEVGDEIIKLGPLIKDVLVGSLKLLTYEITGMVKAFGFILRGMNKVRGLFGAQIGTAELGSMGAAARPTSFQGFSEYEKEIQKAAFTVPSESPQDRIANNTSNIATTMSNLYSFFTGGMWVDRLQEGIMNGMGGIIGNVAGSFPSTGFTKEDVEEAKNEAAGWFKNFTVYGNLGKLLFG